MRSCMSPISAVPWQRWQPLRSNLGLFRQGEHGGGWGQTALERCRDGRSVERASFGRADSDVRRVCAATWAGSWRWRSSSSCWMIDHLENCGRRKDSRRHARRNNLGGSTPAWCWSSLDCIQNFGRATSPAANLHTSILSRTAASSSRLFPFNEACSSRPRISLSSTPRTGFAPAPTRQHGTKPALVRLPRLPPRLR